MGDLTEGFELVYFSFTFCQIFESKTVERRREHVTSFPRPTFSEGAQLPFSQCQLLVFKREREILQDIHLKLNFFFPTEILDCKPVFQHVPGGRFLLTSSGALNLPLPLPHEPTDRMQFKSRSNT